MAEPQSPTDVDVETEAAHDHVVVTVVGELDLAAAPDVRRELAAAAELDRPLVVADLDGVSFVDAAGVTALVHGARRTAEHGGHLTLTTTQQPVRRVLEMTDLEHHLGVHQSVDDALAWAHRSFVFADR